ncbi:MAG TPA: hypothetical protein VIW69_10675, partial [Candidatus Elarobacter sp.]
PGVPLGLRRTGHYRAQEMPVYVSFEGTLWRRLPFAYALPAGDSAAVRLLRLHGIAVDSLSHPWAVPVQEFVIDSVHHAERPFQGHHETSLAGRWRDASTTLPPGTWIVRTGQPLGVVAFYLLEPETDDGLVTWNLFDGSLAVGSPFAVRRIAVPVRGLNEAR